jgi:hypothetical protein
MAKHALGRGLDSLLPGTASNSSPRSTLGQGVPPRGVNLLLRGGKPVAIASAPIDRPGSNPLIICPESGLTPKLESFPASSVFSLRIRSAVALGDVILVSLAVWLGGFSPLAGTLGGGLTSTVLILIAAGAGMLAVLG